MVLLRWSPARTGPIHYFDMPSIKMPMAALFCDVFSFPTIWEHYGLTAAEHLDILTWMNDENHFKVTEEVRSRHNDLVGELQNCSVDNLTKEITRLRKNHAEALDDWKSMFKIIRSKYGPSFDSKYSEILRTNELDAIRRLTKRSLRSNKPGNNDTGQPVLLDSINLNSNISFSSDGSDSDTGDDKKITAGSLQEAEKDILASWLYGVEKGFKNKRGRSARITRLDIFSDAVFRTTWDKDRRQQARLIVSLEKKMKEADVLWTGEYLSVGEEKPLMPYTSSMV